MLWISRLQCRLRVLFRREAMDRELSRELDFHIEEQTAEFIASGMNPVDAAASAQRIFGSKTLFAEDCRETRRYRWIDDFVDDTRFALRSFRRSPAFTLVAVLTLALGIGANTAFFSVAYDVLFRPLSYPQPERLVELEDGIGGVGPVTRLRDLARSTDYGGYLPGNDVNLLAAGEATRVRTAVVTWNLARVLGVAPARGHWFGPDCEVPGRHRVVVLSDGTWRRRFGADPAVLGRPIVLNDEPFEILGVMPPGFSFPTPDTEMWLPVPVDPRNTGYMWGGGGFRAIGRLLPGTTFAAAQTELPSAIDRIRAMYPWRMPDSWGLGARASSYARSLVKDVRPKLFALAAAALLLLLIAAGNVANLLLGRAVRRQREFAMRQALGARPGRLFRQLATENFVLIAAGGVVGLFSAAVILKTLPLLLPSDTPRLTEIRFDPAFVVAAVIGMLGTVFVFGAMPLSRIGRFRSDSLAGRSFTSDRGASGLSLALVTLELAMATALLVGAALMGRTLMQFARVDSGIHSGGRIVSARVSAGPGRCKTRERCWAVVEEMNRVLLGLPGVRSVNWSNQTPLDREISAVAVAIEDHPKPPGAPAWVLWQSSATPGYFRALGIPTLAGRAFDTNDRAGVAPVIVISAATARRFWPNESAIGKRIRPMSDTQWRTVVGVVSDVAQYSLAGYPSWVDGMQYLPLAHDLPGVAQGFDLTVFLDVVQPRSVATAPVSALHEHLPDVVVSRVATLEKIRSDSIADQRSTARLLGVFALLGLLLGTAGVYGVISNRAAQRTREIGIRMALGASRSNVVRMVLRETLLLSLAGCLTGVGAAFVLSRYLRSLLFGVTVHDAAAFAICPLALLAAALLAAAIPGWRASRTDPNLTLRDE